MRLRHQPTIDKLNKFGSFFGNIRTVLVMIIGATIWVYSLRRDVSDLQEKVRSVTVKDSLLAVQYSGLFDYVTKNQDDKSDSLEARQIRMRERLREVRKKVGL